LATYTTVELAVTQLLTIALAVWGFGVYSFAIPAPVMALLRAIAFWMMAKPRLGRIRLKQLRMMGSNSIAVFGTKILTAAVAQGDYFVLGLVAAKPVVGAYFLRSVWRFSRYSCWLATSATCCFLFSRS